MPKRPDVPQGLERSERETYRFQRSMWGIQRVAWLLIGAGLLAAAFGLAGPGAARAVLRPLAIYFGVFLLLRLTGKRSLGEITTFDFVLLLIMSEAVSNALLAGDNSITAALIAVATLVFADIVLALLARKFKPLERILEDEPVLLLANGKPFPDRLTRQRVTEADILEAARRTHGLDRLDQVRFAVLERSGKISIIPAG